MRKIILVLDVIAIVCMGMGMAGAANYMYEKAAVKGVGYVNEEQIISTQIGYEGNKLVHREAGSGNIIEARMELEAERQIDSGCSNSSTGYWAATSKPCMDYINFTKHAEFEYMPVSYQTGQYDVKWLEKLCVQNYKIGAVITEMYTHAESLQKSTEVKTRSYDNRLVTPCCTGVLEAKLHSDVIGVMHIGWLSKDPIPNANALKGRHAEYGRSIEDMTGVFQLEKFIQLWGNSTCQEISIDWLPCT
jgi:hypothetical protein